MKTFAIFAISFLAAGGLIERISRDTNSQAATARGVASYADGEYEESISAMQRAASIAPGPRASFNLGTAQIAAGQNSEGSAELDTAVEDAELRPDALFNRGNSALAASSFEAAIRDYSEVLRLRPGDAAAKRNLEIALRRQENSSQQPDDEGEQEQDPQPEKGEQPPRPGSPQEREAEALLRSVEQQEREELSRMRRTAPSRRRIGW